MNSSIFNSEERYRKQFRIFVTALFLLLVLGGSVNELLLSTVEKKAHEVELQSARFWQDKITPNRIYDVVFLGDSRTYRGVNPEIVGKILALKCYNLGFSAGALNKTILQLAETKLNPDAPQKIIVLGISPRTLSPQGRANSHYRSLRMKKTDSPAGQESWLQTLFFPMSPHRLAVLFRRVQSDDGQMTSFASGWMSTDYRFSQKKYDKLIHNYQILVKNYHISAKSFDELLGAVKEWKHRGFHVFAFRPPTSEEMFEIENRTFDESFVQSAFEKAGGVWLSFPCNAYQTYDASHLTTASSEQFSRDLGEKIKECLTRQ